MQNTPPPPSVPLNLWQELFQVSTQFQMLAPWAWMSDSHVFGLTGNHGIRLISILGNRGEIFGLASYRGSAGAHCLLTLLNGFSKPGDFDTFIQQDALLMCFSTLKELDNRDRAIAKAINFKPAVVRPKLYPQFRSQKPGFNPWYLDEAEARQLLDDLKGAIVFSTLFQKHPNLYDKAKRNEFPFFPDSLAQPLTPELLKWSVLVPTPLPPPPAIDPTKYNLAPLLKLPLAEKVIWEQVAFYSPTPVAENSRPYYPKLFLTVDSKTGFVFGVQVFGPEHTMSSAHGDGLLKAIQGNGFRPAVIRLNSEALLHAIEPLTQALEIKLKHVKSLPMASMARHSLEAFSMRRMH